MTKEDFYTFDVGDTLYYKGEEKEVKEKGLTRKSREPTVIFFDTKNTVGPMYRWTDIMADCSKTPPNQLFQLRIDGAVMGTYPTREEAEANIPPGAGVRNAVISSINPPEEKLPIPKISIPKLNTFYREKGSKFPWSLVIGRLSSSVALSKHGEHFLVGFWDRFEEVPREEVDGE